MGKYLIIVIIVLLAVIGAGYEQVKYANERWKTAEANVKAYAAIASDAKNRSVALQLTIDQLGYLKDSVLQELDRTRKELGVRDRNLKALQSVSSSFSRRDTITLRDTLFREPSLAVDTLLGDRWYQLQMSLRYPSVVAVRPCFRSEKHIVVSSRRETVNPPSRIFFIKWFQKRHTVIHVDVVEQNPYCSDESSRYVEIIK